MADVGRPPLFSNPMHLIDKVEEYFTWCKGEERLNEEGVFVGYIRHPEPITVTGLALFLGFESRQSIYDYEKDGEFSYIIKNAKLRVENAYEKQLYSDKPTGSIFALKNMGWKDKTEQEQYGKDGGPIENMLQIKIIRDKGNPDPISDTPLESTESN